MSITHPIKCFFKAVNDGIRGYCGVLLLIVILLPFDPAGSGKPPRQAFQAQQKDLLECRELLVRSAADNAFLQSLTDPVISSQDELDSQKEKVRGLQNCFELLPAAELPGEFASMHFLIQLFLIFSGADRDASGESTQLLINLQTTQDPAIVKLRDEIGIPPPPGWVFLQVYSTRAAIPGIIREAFQNPQVAGVTILSRYIAILKDSGATWEERALQDQSYPNTVSHELVHAYVNSAVAQQDSLKSSDFPRWFDEGLASYISNSQRPNSIITANGTIRETPSADYQYFIQVFNFLEKRLGKEKLAENIRLAIQAQDISLLYHELGIRDDRWLYAAVDSWIMQRDQQRFIIGLAILGVAILGLYSALPELVCECGYTGRQRDFPLGNCPDCGRPVLGARRLPPRQPVHYIYPNCQVCGRRFWPWQRDQIQITRRWVRAWITNPAPDHPPIARHVVRICRSCQDESQATAENYQKVVDKQISIMRQAYQPVYRQWLAAAPALPEAVIGTVDFPVDEFIDQLISAMLFQLYGEWTIPYPNFLFINEQTQTGDNPNLNLSASGYQSVIISQQTSQVGSIFNKGEDIISILWVS